MSVTKQQQDTAAPRHSGGIVLRLLRPLPTIAVLIVLGAIGYWGHRTGWRIAAFSEITSPPTTEEDAWCTAHGVPESICIACKAELMPKGKLFGWCSEHGVAECVLEHPELAQLSQPTTISEDDLQRAVDALATKERDENDPDCEMYKRRIQFVSAEAVIKAGIERAVVRREDIVESIAVNGKVRYDATRMARLASRASGVVFDAVVASVGEEVGQGDVLALIEAPQVGEAKAALLQAVAQRNLRTKTHERLAGLEGVVPGGRLQEAETALAEADVAVGKAIQTLTNLGLSISPQQVRGKKAEQLIGLLRFLGLPPAVVEKLDPSTTTTNLIPVVAPRAGLVVSRDVVAGEVIDTSKTLFTVVDTSHMWLLLDVPVEDAQHVRLKQKVLFRPDGDREEHPARLTWISTQVDSETRTVQVRAVLLNKEGRLRSDDFGTGRIVLREVSGAIVVPSDAIHWEGCCHVAFVQDKNFHQDGAYKVFHTRMVRPGVTNEGLTEVIAGLLPDEVVVTDGSDVLRRELLKGNLGAG
jgi:cobalt-zinc-cadmium efflux system membrane fusion protein